MEREDLVLISNSDLSDLDEKTPDDYTAGLSCDTACTLHGETGCSWLRYGKLTRKHHPEMSGSFGVSPSKHWYKVFHL